MPAHLREIHIPKCEWPDCPTNARFELRDASNGFLGQFCSTHGKFKLKKIQEQDGLKGKVD